MTISTLCPYPRDVRKTVEIYILNLYESDGVTLRPYNEWPGYYTWPDGQRIPAVFVVGAEMVPSNWNITGIECTISEVPSAIDNYRFGTQTGLVQFERWRTRFTNYGTQEGTRMPVSMLDIRRRLSRTFPNDRFIYSERTEETFESLTGSIMGPVLNPPIF